MRPMTNRVFAEAGICSGMRVVDLGSGAGDVCMLLAEMVGPSGAVIGIELDEEATLHAKNRVAAAGIKNIEFVHSDFTHYAPAAPVDAIVGRLVLMYQPDPGAALAALVKYLRPGGIVAFIEPWFQIPAGPDSTMKTAMTILVETLRRSGAHVDLGPRLHRVFQAADLPLPNMRFEAIMDPRDDSPIYQYVADTVGNLLPRAVQYGIPGAAELNVVSIPAGIRREFSASGYAMITTPVVCAWGRKKA